MESGFLAGDEVSNVDFAYKQCTQNMVVDFQCRDHPDPIVPALSWSSHDINFFDLNSRIICNELSEIFTR